jgi:hypothetical protein
LDGILEERLRRTVSTEFKVKGEHIATFKPYLSSLGEYLRAALESGGTIPEEFLPRIPGAKVSKDGMARFNTPPGANWNDLRIRFRDGHTVSVEVLGERGVFNYTQMGMADRRTSNPTKQWELLKDFAAGYGLLAWGMAGAGPEKKKRRERLAQDLQSFFRIVGDPFRLLEDRTGWQTRFLLAPKG